MSIICTNVGRHRFSCPNYSVHIAARVDLRGAQWWRTRRPMQQIQEVGGLIPGSRRSPGEGKGHPLQDSYLEESRDRGASMLHTVHGAAKSWTWMSSLTVAAGCVHKHTPRCRCYSALALNKGRRPRRTGDLNGNPSPRTSWLCHCGQVI